MSDDTISRQAALDALNGEIEITGRTNAEAVKGYVRLVGDRLARLPSAQPEITEKQIAEYCRKRNLVLIAHESYAILIQAYYDRRQDYDQEQ